MTGAVFTSVKTEGGLLPVDLLRRVSLLDKDLPGLRAEDYGLAPGERLPDAIVRSWNRLLPVWERFTDKLAMLPASETSAQTQTREQWTKWLLDELGFHRIEAANPVVIDDKPYPVSHRSEGVALHLVGARVDIEHRAQLGGRAPHSMVQEFLNRDDDYLWAMVSNGLHLRILRDSSSLTRQAYCDFDLDAIFSGQLYADFALCWLVCHATRFKPPIETGADDASKACWLEQWSDTARTEGVRVLDELRSGVEAAIEALGSGLLTPANVVLRERLRDGELTTQELQRQLLRLVYRLLFLLVAESRDLLNDPDAPDEAKARYRNSYSITRLVELARRQRGSLHTDLWTGLQIVFTALAGPGAPPLGLVGLGSFLWSPASIPDIAEAVIPNRQLLEAIEKLTMFESSGVLRRVDYKNLGAEELGSVYESLLETHAEVDLTNQTVSLSTAAGNERKTTGSYYTPSSLIRVLLDSALDPVLDEAEQAEDPEASLLALKVLDPAAGSGHFLIAAASRIAHRLASARSGDIEPSPTELRHALRDVISHCIYGIDVNPLSVELCKVSLWMEAMEPGKPLSFLDHRIVCGNSLLGATPALIQAGIPDSAYKALTGDDKPVVTAMKRRNKAERDGQRTLGFSGDYAKDTAAIAAAVADIDALPGDTPEQIALKEQRYEQLRSGEVAERQKLAADAWCAAFVSEKTTGSVQITTDLVRRCVEDLARVSDDERRCIEGLATDYRLLHPHLAFPDVFGVPATGEKPENDKCGWSGGFDAVLGNPPWDQIQYDPIEAFSQTHPEISGAPNAAARTRRIEELRDSDPDRYRRHRSELREVQAIQHLVHNSGRYPLGSVGRLNTAPLFVEFAQHVTGSPSGIGLVIPSGVATDSFTQGLFRDMVTSGRLASFYDFINDSGLFPGVGHGRQKFALVTLSSQRRSHSVDFFCFAQKPSDLGDGDRHFKLHENDFELLNPNTRTLPIFRSSRDAELTKAIYRRVPIVMPDGHSDPDSWRIRYLLMVMMNTDSHLFADHPGAELVDLFEAKMIHQFTTRWGDYDLRAPGSRDTELPRPALGFLDDPAYEVSPRYWFPREEAERRLADAGPWLIGWRNVARSTDERTIISAVVPRGAYASKFSLALLPSSRQLSGHLLVANLNAFVLDFVARQKIGGTDIALHYFKQLPILPPSTLSKQYEWLCPGTVAEWLSSRVVELSYNSWRMAAFSQSIGFDLPPFHWNPQRREALRSELDALFFRLYSVNRADTEYILDTFPIVKRKDESQFGEYRTKRLILERYDAMAKAEADGVEYETVLDPPPADPSLCHSESTRPDWATTAE